MERPPIDRGADWIAAVSAACSRSGLPEDEVRRIKAGLIMKQGSGGKGAATPFRQAADQVYASIGGLRAFIDENKRDYAAPAGRFTPQQKDAIEAEVLTTVGGCRARLEQLTASVVAAQKRSGGGGRAEVNEHTAAHLHGCVLALAELLAAVGAAFDRCRAVRGAQQMAADLQTAQRRAAHYSAGPLHRQPAAAGGRSSSRPSDGFGAGSGSGGGEPWQQQQPHQQQQQQQQQQLVDDQETQQLLDELTRSTQQAAAVERTVREIATMQQMLSTAVMQQAEQIEALYNVAVEATLNVRRGNEQVKRTIAVNASSTRYLVVLLLTLSALMLFFDWLNS